MALKELKEKAKNLGIKPKIGMKKVDLIRSIQTAEGNFSCFGTAKDYCDQMSCCWREDCLPVSK
jgi:hypothetical protein